MTRNTSSASITNSSLSPYALNDLIKVSGVSLCFFPHWLVSLGFLESESYPGALFSSGWLKTQSASPAQPPKCRYCRWPKVLREWLKVLLKKSPFSSCFFTALSYKGKKRPWKREPGKQLLLNCKLNWPSFNVHIWKYDSNYDCVFLSIWKRDTSSKCEGHIK